MTRFTCRTLIAALVAAVALGSVARADDSDLFTPTPPNVLIILDTSQSMTWYDRDGNTVGDEFPRVPPDSGATFPGSRIWMAKDVLDLVITQYSDQINFGLASYKQGAPGNVTVYGLPSDPGGGALWSHYYSIGWAAFPLPLAGTNPTYHVIGDRYYLKPWIFNIYTPQAGLGGPAVPADPSGYNPATLRPNSLFFRVQWRLRPDVNPNPAREFSPGQAYIPPTTHPEDRCRYGYQRSDDGGVSWYDWGGTWDSSPAGCPPVGPFGGPWSIASVTVDKVCDYQSRKPYDDPRPYVYSCVRRNNGAPFQSFTEDFQDLHVPHPHYEATESFTPGYMQRYRSLGIVSITVVDTPGQPYRPDQYRWTYYNDATCNYPRLGTDPPSNCANNGSFWQWTWSTPWFSADPPCNANMVNNPWLDPPAQGRPSCGSPWANQLGQPVWTPSETGYWGGLPFVQEYRWQGNNYKLISENSCAPSGGAQVLVDVGSGNLAQIKNFLGTGTDPTRELHAANLSTPLAGALQTAYDYFTNSSVVQGDPSKNCRGHFVILITDGGESCQLNQADTLTVPPAKAAALRGIDLGPPAPNHGVKTFVVGIDQGGLSTDERTVLNNIVDAGGTARDSSLWGDPPKHYYAAANRTDLQAALQRIFGTILSGTYTFTAPILPRIRFGDNKMAILSSLTVPARDQTTGRVPGFWRGSLTAYRLLDDPDGALARNPDGSIDISPGRSEVLWSATTAGSRTMKIGLSGALGGGVADFTAGNDTVRKAVGCLVPGGPPPAPFVLNPDFPDVDGNGVLDTRDCDALVNLLKGDATLATRFPWTGTMGDIFHSQPVVVGDPSATYIDNSIDPSTGDLLSQAAAPSTYTAFRNSVRSNPLRIRLAIVGANGGFLHAFNDGNWDAGQGKYVLGVNKGKEVWAYSPPNFYNPTSGRSTLANLGEPTGAHNYYVDGSARVADVWLDDNNDGVKVSSEWHTVALVSLRQGGQGIFHLDITDKLNPRPISNGATPYPAFYPTCGYSWSEPAIGKVKVQIGGKKVDRWVAFFGDGEALPDRTTIPGCGKKFYAVDLKTGRSLWEVSASNDPAMTFSMVGSPILLDRNGDGYVDLVYAGDKGGQIWRFDVSAVGTNAGGDVDPLATPTPGLVTNWVVSRLYQGASGQSFYEKLAAALDPQGNLWVFGGTGDRFNPLSLDPPDDVPVAGKGANGRLFGIRDNYPSRVDPWLSTNLRDVTNANTFNPITTEAGWFIKLDRSEKNFTPAEVFNRNVFFATLKPESTPIECRNSSSRLYVLHYLTGGGATDVAAFTAANPTASNRFVTLGGGAPTRPVISTLALGGGGVLITGTSNQKVKVGLSPDTGGGDLQLNAPRNLRAVRYWRQN